MDPGHPSSLDHATVTEPMDPGKSASSAVKPRPVEMALANRFHAAKEGEAVPSRHPKTRIQSRFAFQIDVLSDYLSKAIVLDDA